MSHFLCEKISFHNKTSEKIRIISEARFYYGQEITKPKQKIHKPAGRENVRLAKNTQDAPDDKRQGAVRENDARN